MTLLWFVIWFISDHIGDRELLQFAPADVWAWTLLGAIALDLSSLHGRKAAKRK